MLKLFILNGLEMCWWKQETNGGKKKKKKSYVL